MLLLDAVPVTSCHDCVATLTLPLALFLILAETTVGGIATVAYLRLAGGLTPGFLKFIAVTYAILGVLAFLVVLASPPGSYHRLLAINQPAANALVFLQGCFVLALVVNAVISWRSNGPSTASWALTLLASVLVLAGIAAALGPMAGSLPVGRGPWVSDHGDAARALVPGDAGADESPAAARDWRAADQPGPAGRGRALDAGRGRQRLRLADPCAGPEPGSLGALGARLGDPAPGGRRPGAGDLPDAFVHVDDRPPLPGDDRHPPGATARPAALLRGRLRLIAGLPPWR